MVQLLDLPPELIQEICRQCLRPSSEFHSPSSPVLASLARTCSTLRAYAQPELYCAPSPYRYNYVALVRTLVKRPDLAQLVQDMVIGDDWSRSDDRGLLPDDVQLFEALMAKYPAKDGKPVEISTHWWETVRDNRQRDRLFDCDPEAALASLVVTQIPNVESLDITAGYFWEFPFSTPASLSCLKKLSLRHADTELGTNTDVVKNILLAAPKLDSFYGTMLCRVDDGFQHDNLTEFHLEFSSLEEQSFQNIARGLPKLKSFAYSSGGAIISDDPEATPGEMIRALLRCASTLEHMSLDIEDAWYFEDFGPNDWISDLKGMRHLKTLLLSSSTMDIEESDRNLLTDMLPASIHKLTLINAPERIMDAFGRLAENADSFLNLVDLLLVGAKDDYLRDVQAIFKTTKINVSAQQEGPC
ncbi:hypothetical protein B0T10DRAFT_45922 [Thelonectria olida]|uniref:F-box domain-containing protein n=1 Tax=Thelonectria olida TaxID=1576542 RepID=A0A9P8VNU8_9HYPO|nr:hypothetical protein B0T10DRAFT_45922 [Thelonectria olida]